MVEGPWPCVLGRIPEASGLIDILELDEHDAVGRPVALEGLDARLRGEDVSTAVLFQGRSRPVGVGTEPVRVGHCQPVDHDVGRHYCVRRLFTAHPPRGRCGSRRSEPCGPADCTAARREAGGTRVSPAPHVTRSSGPAPTRSYAATQETAMPGKKPPVVAWATVVQPEEPPLVSRQASMKLSPSFTHSVEPVWPKLTT